MTEPESIPFDDWAPRKRFDALLIPIIQHLRLADTHSSNFEFLSSLPFGGYNYVHHTEAISQKYAIHRYISFNIIFGRLLFPVSHSVSVTQCKKSYAIDVCVSMHSVYFASKFNRWSYCVLHLAHGHSSLVSEFTMSCYSFNIKISINFIHIRISYIRHLVFPMKCHIF